MKKLFLPLIILFQTSVLSAQNTGSLGGTVTDAKTGKPLIRATVLIQGTQLGALTDSIGRYLIRNVPAKTYNVESKYLGYTTNTKFNIVIRSEGNIDLNFEMEESSVALEEIVVRPNPFEKSKISPLSVQNLSQEEIAAYPGGNNDIAKVVQSLPGISGSVGGFRNDVIIRGGAPSENVYYLDGIEIPNINHFSTQGSAGGPIGLLNVSFFEGVTLSASAFGAQYDNVLSGVLQFDQRKGNEREFVGNVRVGSSETALTLEGPLFKGNDEKAKASYLVSVRRSYLQLLFELIGLPFLPDYWDFQYKVNFSPDAFNDIYITGVGSIDDFAVNELDEFDATQQASQDQVPVIRQRTNTVGIGWKKRFTDYSGFLQVALSTNLLNNELLRFEDNVREEGKFFENDSREFETRLRVSMTKFLGDWTTTFGGQLVNGDYTNTTLDLVEDREFNSELTLYRYGAFVQTSTSFLQDRLSFSAGLRLDGNSFTESGNDIWRTLSPRVSASYQLDETGIFSLNASLGRYFKILPYTTLGFQDSRGEFSNKDSEYIRTDHVVLGLEYLVSSTSRITIEGFYKQYGDYPVSVSDDVSLANKGGGFEVFGSEPVNSIGKGRTYGVELLYQQKFTGRYYAIAAFTFYKSEFTGSETDTFLPAVWDNGILISLLGGYKFGNNWEVSSRYRLLGKAPFVPVNQDATLENYPAIILDYNRFGEERLDVFSQLDLRIDKKWSFKKFSLDLFLDVQNILGQEIPEEPQFGLVRDDEGAILTPRRLTQVNTEGDGSVLPSIGIVINF
ncbi:MAG: TonB-dependent receptor [Bacteroidota bacterium]